MFFVALKLCGVKKMQSKETIKKSNKTNNCAFAAAAVQNEKEQNFFKNKINKIKNNSSV